VRLAADLPRRRWACLAMAAAGAVLLAHPASAQGMPQLDFRNALTGGQVFWGALIFFGMFLVLKRSALPKVEQVLEMRAATISANLEAAHAAKSEADAAVAELTEANRVARASAQAQITKAVDDAKAAAAAQSAELNAKLEAQLAEAETRIADAQKAAMGALREVATETTSNLVARLTGRPVDTARVDQAVADALTARAA
jgi:F-type H+-transporting ATPase subunit b